MNPGRVALAGFFAAALSSMGCGDPCLLVTGCHDDPRLAVEGRIVTSGSGSGKPETVVMLLSERSGGIDSTAAVTDNLGLFSLILPTGQGTPGSLALRIKPPDKPGYVLAPLACDPPRQGADACVLDPLVEDPGVPIFRFVYRSDASRPITRARVTFRRTSGARMEGAKSLDSVTVRTDDQGFAFLFSPGTYASSLDAVVGTLTVALPAPIGVVKRPAYHVFATPRFNVAEVVVQMVGPSLSYAMLFADSATGEPLEGVEMHYNRRSGIKTSADSGTSRSIIDGRAFLSFLPLAQGNVTIDFTVQPFRSGGRTSIPGVVLPTFDADSSIVFARWSVGSTGTLYPASPP